MSLDYIVFCRHRPAIAAGTHRVGPVDLSAPEPRSDGDDWALDQIPAEARAEAGDWVVGLNCHHSAGEIADELAAAIAECCGGGWIVCDALDEAMHVEAGEPSTAQDLLPELGHLVGELVGDAQQAEAARQQAAVAAWQRDRVADPAGHADADDWSDV
jgi:hypothetical protein